MVDDCILNFQDIEGLTINENTVLGQKDLALSSIVPKNDGCNQSSNSNIFDELSDLLRNKFSECGKIMNQTESAAQDSNKLLISKLLENARIRRRNIQIESTPRTPFGVGLFKKEKTATKTMISSPRNGSNNVSPRIILQRLRSNLEAIINKGGSPTGIPYSTKSARVTQGSLLISQRSQERTNAHMIKSDSSHFKRFVEHEVNFNIDVLKKMNIHILDKYIRPSVSPNKDTKRVSQRALESSPKNRTFRQADIADKLYSSQAYQTPSKRIHHSYKKSEQRLSFGIADTQPSTNDSKEKITLLYQSSSTQKMITARQMVAQNGPETCNSVRDNASKSSDAGQSSLDLQRLLQMKKKLKVISDKRKKMLSSDANISSSVAISDGLKQLLTQQTSKIVTITKIAVQSSDLYRCGEQLRQKKLSSSGRDKQEGIKRLTITFWEKAAATKQRLALK